MTAPSPSDADRPTRMPHRFHSMEYVAKWAQDVGNPVRESVFHHILAQLVLLDDESPHIVELASGPGILAEFLLERLPNATYEGLDYSAPMLSLARERTQRFGERVHLHQVDLREDDWPGARCAAPAPSFPCKRCTTLAAKRSTTASTGPHANSSHRRGCSSTPISCAKTPAAPLESRSTAISPC